MRYHAIVGVLIAAMLQMGCAALSTGGNGEKATPTTGNDAVADLENTYWKLIELHGEAIIPQPNQAEPHLTLNPQGNRVTGSGGCNRFFGTYEIRNATIRFSQLGSTRMACPVGMDEEAAFFQALESADRYVITDDTLELYSAEKQLARFNAMNRK